MTIYRWSTSLQSHVLLYFATLHIMIGASDHSSRNTQSRLVPKTGMQLRNDVENLHVENKIAVSHNSYTYAIKSDNNSVTTLIAELLTNYVGSAWGILYTIAFAVSNVFLRGTVWQRYMDHFNKVKTCFNCYALSSMILRQNQLDDGTNQDDIKDFIMTSWRSATTVLEQYWTTFHESGTFLVCWRSQNRFSWDSFSI